MKYEYKILAIPVLGYSANFVLKHYFDAKKNDENDIIKSNTDFKLLGKEDREKVDNYSVQLDLFHEEKVTSSQHIKCIENYQADAYILLVETDYLKPYTLDELITAGKKELTDYSEQKIVRHKKNKDYTRKIIDVFKKKLEEDCNDIFYVGILGDISNWTDYNVRRIRKSIEQIGGIPVIEDDALSDFIPKIIPQIIKSIKEKDGPIKQEYKISFISDEGQATPNVFAKYQYLKYLTGFKSFFTVLY